MSPDRIKFARRAFPAIALVLLVSSFALSRQASAREACSDPNLLDRIDQFIWKPSPEDLILPPGQDDTGGKTTDKKPKHGKK